MTGWRAEEVERTGGLVWRVVDADGTVIVASTDRETARLFAASPDLLRAVRMLVKYETCRDPNRGALFTPALTVAQNAIAKAEGVNNEN